MFRSTLIAAMAAFAAVASAQNYSTSGNLTVDLTQIPQAMLQDWCLGQRNTCRQLCDQTSSNTCDATTQIWSCTCMGGNTPNISDYQQSSPAQVCRQWVANCVDGHPNDLDGQAGCYSVKCGNKTTDETATMTSSTASLSATAAPSSSGSDSGDGGSSMTQTSTASTPSATKNSAAVAMNLAQNYGTGIFGAALLALFGLAL